MPNNPFRNAFEIPEDITYLNCAFHSPLLTAARDAAHSAITARSKPWEMRASELFSDVEKSRQLFARLIGGDPEGVAVVPSVSYGMAVAAQNLSLRRGSRILLPEGEFPSNVYIWREYARQNGIELVTVPAPDDFDWTRAVLKYLDERVSMVTVPPCHWCDGSRFDLKKIGERARSVGAKFLIDGSQALGTYPVNVADWDPDYLVCVGYKWLLGPYGVSFLYVPPRHREGSPLELSWANRKGCEDLSRLCDYTDYFSPGARRFDVGQKMNPILLPMFNASLEKLLEWGPETVQRQITAVSSRLTKELTSLGISLIPEEYRMPHIIGVRSPNVRQWAASLQENKIFVSARHESLRISPHIYNEERDVVLLKSVLEKLL